MTCDFAGDAGKSKPFAWGKHAGRCLMVDPYSFELGFADALEPLLEESKVKSEEWAAYKARDFYKQEEN